MLSSITSQRSVSVAMALISLAYLIGCGGTWVIAKIGYINAPIRGDQATVRYALGTPDRYSVDGQSWLKQGDADGARMWRYSSPHILVVYDPSTVRSESITCIQEPTGSSAACPGVLGVKIGDAEQDILEILGTPTYESIANGRKTVHFQEVGYSFILERLHVVGIRKTPSEGDLLGSVNRFLIWLIP